MSEPSVSGAPASSVSNSGESTSLASGKRVYTPPAAEPKQAVETPTYKGTKHKVRLEGQEAEVDYDELVSGYQKAQVSTKRFQEASKVAGQSQEVLKKLAEGDIGFLVEKMGAQKAKALFEDYLIQEMEEDALSPAEKKAKALEKRNQTLEQQLEQRKKQDLEAERDSYMTKAHQEIDEQVADALTKLGKKPTPRVVLRIVDDMIARISDDAEGGWNADIAAKSAINSIHKDIVDYLGGLSADEIVKVMPPEILKMIREHEVNQVVGTKAVTRVKGDVKPASGTKRKGNGFSEAFKEIENRFGRY